jgi:ABC-type transport system involved in multi-copper enzyme maturation permease subunit
MISEALTLVRADLLKLRRRRGLMTLAAGLVVGGLSLIFIVNALRHGSNPVQNPPAGGVKHFENATDFVGLMSVVVAAIIGATAGAGDSETGVLRDLVATGRSRVALYASRAAAGVAITLAIVVAALVVASVLSVVLAGSLQAPSFSYILHRGVGVLAFAAVSALIAVGIATFVRSRGPVVAVVIGFGIVVSQILLQITFLGNARAALPLSAFERMVGDTRTAGLYPSLALSITVVVAWALAAIAAGSWWSRRVEV